MTDSITLRRRGARPLSAFAAVLATLAGMVSVAAAQPGQGPAPVAVAALELRDVTGGQSFVGTVMPLRRATVGSAIGGRVVEFLVNEGDRVERGQPLAKLLRESAEIERDAAKAELLFRQESLAELENGSRPEEIEQAKARMGAAEALRDYTRAKLERTRSLIETRAASEDQLQNDESAALSAEQTYLAAKADHDLVTVGPRAEKIAQARAQVAVAQEQLNKLEDMLRKHTIVAPFGGYVAAEFTEVGQWISTGDPVAEIVEVDQVDVEVPVLETFVEQLRVGAEAHVELDALADRAFTGRVALIVPQADVRSRSFPVKVRLENTILEDGQPLVRPGMFARVTLPVAAKKSALLAPKDALVLGGPEPRVFVVDRDPAREGFGTARPVPVQLGVSADGLIEVSGALQPGELVVVEGNERLRPGAAVAIKSLRTESTAAAEAPPTNR